MKTTQKLHKPTSQHKKGAKKVHNTAKRDIKVLVPVKRVSDAAVRVRVAADKKGVDLNGVKMSMNPFCHIATEEAVRLKEKKVATSVIAVTIGPKESQEILRTALAMGADKAIHIESTGRLDQDIQPLHVAKALKALAEREQVDLVMTGKQSIDSDSNQVGQMLGGLLNWPQATNISKLSIADKIATVEREADKGVETLELTLPSVVTADLRLNEPRFASLPNIMKARKVAIETIKLADLIDSVTPHYQTMEVVDPPKRTAGIKVDSVEALVAELKGKALI